MAEDADMKTEQAVVASVQQDEQGGGLAQSSNALERHNTDTGGMAVAGFNSTSNPSLAPILPLPAQLNLYPGHPPILAAALNQAMGQGHLQPSLHVQDGQMPSMQSLLQGDEPVQRSGPLDAL